MTFDTPSFSFYSFPRHNVDLCRILQMLLSSSRISFEFEGNWYKGDLLVIHFCLGKMNSKKE